MSSILSKKFLVANVEAKMTAGRQREFKKEQALDAAMHVFWQKGYLGASLTDLTTRMGINKPSLYAAFGNKEKLFIQATEHYIKHYASPHAVHLTQHELSLKERLTAYMHSAISSQCDKTTPKGCYISLCLSETASETLPALAKSEMGKVGIYAEQYLTNIFSEEKQSLPKHMSAKEIALLIVTTLHGTAAQARAGKQYEELRLVADQVIAMLFNSTS